MLIKQMSPCQLASVKDDPRKWFSTVFAEAEWQGDYAHRMTVRLCAHNNKEIMHA